MPKTTPSGTATEAVHWALTVGRYLVIFTEIIALGAFLVAIWLSKEKNDLKTSIKQRQAEVNQYQTCDAEDPEKFCEDRFRLIQNQINQVTTLDKSQVENNPVLTELLTLLPVGIQLENLSLDKNQLTFLGTLPSGTELQTLIESFNSSGKVSSLDITSLTKENNILRFTATAVVQRAGFNQTEGQN